MVVIGVNASATFFPLAFAGTWEGSMCNLLPLGFDNCDPYAYVVRLNLNSDGVHDKWDLSWTEA
jgi:hypothetical protein